MQETTKEIRDKVVLVGLNSPVLKKEENRFPISWLNRLIWKKIRSYGTSYRML